MILNGHHACPHMGAFAPYFKATAASPALAVHRRYARSLRHHTWTFDDGFADVTSIYHDYFAPVGLRFQLFICPALTDAWEQGRIEYVRERLRNPRAVLMPWKDVVALLEAGNVIGSHGIDHRSFDDLGADESAEQLEGSRELIEQRIGYRPTSFAFPFGAVRPSSGDAGAFARRWYDEVHLSDNRLALGELTDGVFNRRHAEFGTCAYRGIAVGGLNVLFGIRKWRS